MDRQKLIEKYNVPAPRYTSYPTVPLWQNEDLQSKQWLRVVKKAFRETNQEKGISIYIHLPFCESLCTYCGCNKRITKNHAVEKGYIDAVLAEWKLYLQTFDEKPIIREMHLGGGTPTFFSAGNLKYLIETIIKDSIIHPEHDFGFEGHPNNTKEAHLKVLYDLGFHRVSFGVQDLDFKVQQAINRIQPFKNVQLVTDLAREIGYTSINFDLIYGLPFQSLESIDFTIEKVKQLMPDRIAFYSYAHVPWLKKSQRGYSEADLPSNEDKRKLYELGLNKLLEMGYLDIGMDHFALPGDSLQLAASESRLHRNFMGYTVSNTELLIGLGCSAISDAKYAYMQNEKVVEAYKDRVLANQLAIVKGHNMSDLDLLIRKSILELLCDGKVNWSDALQFALGAPAKTEYLQMQEEGLIRIAGKSLEVTEKGKPFIRNIAMVMDLRLKESKPSDTPMFSKAI